jgi:hypothetical protein
MLNVALVIAASAEADVNQARADLEAGRSLPVFTITSLMDTWFGSLTGTTVLFNAEKNHDLSNR